MRPTKHAPIAIALAWLAVAQGPACSKSERQGAAGKASPAQAPGVSASDAGISNGSPFSEVRLSAASFNPRNEQVRLTWVANRAAVVTVAVWDPDGGLVRTLREKQSVPAGTNSVEWDGKDLDGRPVPDEAYTFTLVSEDGAVYDPWSNSGGIVGDLTNANFDSAAGTMVYTLPEASRVLIRLGVKHGPMLKTLVDWKPRLAGMVTEYWNGKDENQVIALREHKDFNALVTYVTLPSATVIAYGNSNPDYRTYKQAAVGRPEKPERPREPDPQGRLRPEGLVPPASSRAPRVVVQFASLDAPVPTIPRDEVVEVRVDVDEADRAAILKDQFEVIFYVDGVFFAEAERGYLPYTWKWELTRLPPGEHVLTVNVCSFRGQVGVASKKLFVAEGKPPRSPRGGTQPATP